MKNLSALLIISVIIASIITAGCASTSSSHSTIDAILLNHTFTGETTHLHAHERIHYNVTTDGTPVNVLVFDARGFELYQNQSNAPGDGYSPLVTYLNYNRLDFNYSVPTSGVYYVVIDNTGKFLGDVVGYRDVRIVAHGSFNERA